MDSVKAAKSFQDLHSVSKGEDIMSPEGVEERVVIEAMFMVTLTQGGKYRIYRGGSAFHHPECKCKNEHVIKPYQELKNTDPEARKIMGAMMVYGGELVIDPIGTMLESMFGGILRDLKPKD